MRKGANQEPPWQPPDWDPPREPSPPPAPPPAMAPPDPQACSAAGCGWSTPAGLPHFEQIIQLMTLHTTQAHPALQGGGGDRRPTTKVDKRPRPEISMEMTEHDWRFFLSEWQDYKRATGIAEQDLLDELWSCMTPELKRLAFDQGGKDTLVTEALMLTRIRQLAVSVLHAAVHTVALHDARQAAEEPTKTFAARVRGIASNCELTKDCGCGQKVSFLEETVYHVVMAGLRDRDMQDRCLSAAIMKTIKDINSLVEFCSAEESGRMTVPGTVGGLRSSYQQGKGKGLQDRHSHGRCDWCGGAPHSAWTRQAREKECKAFQHTCQSCSKQGHFTSCCRGAQWKGARSPGPVKTTQRVKAKNAAVEKQEEDGKVESFAFCAMVAVKNFFHPLEDLGGAEPSMQRAVTPRRSRTWRPRSPKTPRDAQSSSHPTADYHRSDTVGCTRYSAVPVVPVVDRYPELPRRGTLAYPPPSHQPPTLEGELAGLKAGLSRQSARLPLCHMEYVEGPGQTWSWKETVPLASPLLPVSLQIHAPSYSLLDLPQPKTVANTPLLKQPSTVEEQVVADTGAQMDICSMSTAKSLGVDTNSLLPVRARVYGASKNAEIQILGGIFLEVRPPGPHQNINLPRTVRLFYVADNVSRTYLSLATLIALGVVDSYFPRIKSFLPQVEVAATETGEVGLPKCSNSGVVLPGETPCSCPKRALPPSGPVVPPCTLSEENLPQLKQFLLQRYAASTFNTCEHQPLPLLKGSPPLELHVDKTACPKAVHTPAVVPLHWQQAVKEGLDRDVRLGVLERVPLNTPVGWQSRMVVVAKQNGSPRRTVDYQAVNNCSPRQTHHTMSPWLLVSSIPAGKKKSTFDAWHGYHSLELASEEDRAATSFITCWGRYRYRTCPQGFLAAGDAYTDRLDRLLQEFERQERCIDDTLLYDDTIEEAFHRACKFLETCGRNGILLNPQKFQLAQNTVEFLGFQVTDTGVQPTQAFTEAIMSFPTPASLTDVRSWFGAVAQVSYAFAQCPVMQPFRHLLSSKTPFSWSPELEAAFQTSKAEVVRQCWEGVRSFDPRLPTALATDWSKTGMGFWLTQKRCVCEGMKPGCCNTGWQTVFVGSRFCTGAEQRYSPICGEAAAAAWGVEKCKFFLLGHPQFQLCLDHRPLLKIFSSSMDLAAIPNPRLFNQKVKLLPYRFQPVFIPGKFHVIPDCYSRRGDSPVQQPQPHPDIDLLDIQNVGPDYSSTFGPPSWVAGPGAGEHGGGGRGPPPDPRGPVQGPPLQSAHTLLASMTAHPLEAATTQNLEDTWRVEEHLVAVARASLAQLDTECEQHCAECEVASVRQDTVRALTWPRLKEAVAASPVCQSLLELLDTGLPEDRSDWPELLQPYFPYRHHLVDLDRVILAGERPLIPPSLRPEVLDHLHSAHHGVTKMLARANQSVFWPGLQADVTAHRAACKACTVRAPSNPAPPPSDPVQPDFPFSHVVADFFQVDATYLAMADRYSNWLSVFKLKKDDSPHLIEALRQYFSRWGVSKDLTSDGASVFVSSLTKGFLDRWGVRHRVASAYYPRGNKRAEVAVKSAKRLVTENLGPGGSLDTDKFARALLAHRNCPDSETGLSPAQILFGRQLRDHLPALVSRYEPRKEWRLEADLREKAMAKRHGKMEELLKHGAKSLPPLSCGDCVAVQDQKTNNGKPGRWTKSGEVVEVLPHDSYMVRIHGSRAPTQRNRRFLRKITPFSPIIPVTVEETATPALTRARSAASSPSPDSEPPGPATLAPASPTSAPPGPVRSAGPTAVTHRLPPVAAPGQDLINLLRQQEAQGLHLALEMLYN